MDKYAILIRLIECFPGGFINRQEEFIAHAFSNQYFCLKDCKTEGDVKVKILSWFSRGAYKSDPYSTKRANDRLHEFMLNGINKFLGTSFTYTDMDHIYTKFGNGANKNLCYDFVNSGYDLTLIYGR